jgi:arylsulfatase A-like enzyme
MRTTLTGQPARALLAFAFLAALAAVIASCSIAGGKRPARPSADAGAPNVVVVMTDDQAVDTMQAMPRTRRLLGEGGTDFAQALVSFPLCCPSRASFLTGQYAHNHGVRDNHPPAGGIGALDQRRTLPVWMQAAGYRTGFVGKYLNGYGKRPNGGARYVPPGWDGWVAAEGREKTGAYGYELNENGRMVSYGGRPADYKTDVLADRAVDFVRSASQGSRPFFLWVATSAPHTDNGLPRGARRNPLPAKSDRGRFGSASVPRGPAFDERDVDDKPAFVRRNGRLSGADIAGMRRTYVSQLESLIAVDRMVGRLVGELRRNGELDDTIVIFTSDNGYLRGQHRIDSGKSKAYDESVRVPLLVRGPGFPAGRTVSTPVANIDMTRTIVEAAGARAGVPLDGVDLRDSLKRPDRSVLLEVFERRDDRFTAVRRKDWLYVEHDGGEIELYDRSADPGELRNLAADERYRPERDRLAAELRRLRDCSGSGCR